MIALALVVGVGVGLVVGTLGAGGGILSVPVLVYLLGQDAHTAAASSLVVVGATAAVSLPHHARSGSVVWRRGALFALASVVGSVLGARVSALVPATALMGMFSAMLAVVGVVMLRKGLRARRMRPVPSQASGQGRGPVAVMAAALCTGFLTGFFGVGGGFVVVPMLVLALELDMRRAAGTSLLIMVITSISGLLARVGTDIHIDWALTLAFAASSMLGGMLGGPLSTKAKPWVLTVIFGVLLLTVSLVVAVSTLSGLTS
ncbi:sulfite exporter TauE/SafE family protein [Actinomyces sp. MRS3W]|uniref:sulfite exporter TauE/SafE family protein n=1 Tax=Actinomyces sp. MRS3W TaxID=2800796 RepID=UPI0028FD4F7A|nr:sulfite exporter TauE/SafE family protein [Actinomyces sp. MRS3W]MDU0349315.1 sulfite exporter TauE/SafE family protein [Actinomyces sp. MRS3W]